MKMLNVFNYNIFLFMTIMIQMRSTNFMIYLLPFGKFCFILFSFHYSTSFLLHLFFIRECDKHYLSSLFHLFVNFRLKYKKVFVSSRAIDVRPYIFLSF